MTTQTQPQPNTLTPSQRLAKIVAEETDEGRDIVRFLSNAAKGLLRDFQPNHRMDAAKELVKIGIEEFADYTKPPARRKRASLPRPNADPDDEISPELQAARSQLSLYVREMTGDGRTLVMFYVTVMEGFMENPGGFKPNHRMAAAKELIKMGFGANADPSIPQPGAESPVYQVHPTTQARYPVYSHETFHLGQTEYPARSDEPAQQEQPEEPESETYLAAEEYMDRQIAAHLYGEKFASVMFDPEIRNAVCPCAKDETGETPCPNTEEECPYYGIEFPKFTEEQEQLITDFAMGRINIYEDMNRKLRESAATKEPEPDSGPESEPNPETEPDAQPEPDPQPNPEDP